MSSPRGVVLGAGAIQLHGVQRHFLAVLDLDAEAPRPWMAPLEFLGHALALDPCEPSRFLVFEKKGPGAAAVRLERGASEVIPLATRRERRFYGHGAFSGDGRLLYAAESYVEDGARGALVVRDGRSLAELGVLPTGGAAPHDCVLVDGGRTMVVTHGGGPLGGEAPCVTWVELASGRVLERLELDAPHLNTGHVAVTGAGDLAVVSAPRDGLPTSSLGGLTLRRAGGAARTLAEPADVVGNMLGETLSVVIHEPTNTVIATHPAGDMATAWDLRTGALRRAWRGLQGVRGAALTLDGATLVLSHLVGGTPTLSLFDAGTLETTGRLAPSFMTGSHIFVHALGQGAPQRL
jgi:hypothetical protein